MDEEKKTQRIRSTAQHVPINVIVNGRYVKEDEDFTPNYISVGEKKISRVNIIGIVVSLVDNERGGKSIVIDDGTAEISARGFDQTLIPSDIVVGDIINIIGRPREFNSERYIVLEIIKKTSQEWMRVRKKELENSFIPDSQEIEEKKEENIEKNIVEEDLSGDEKEEANTGEEGLLATNERIIQYIKKNEQGKGVEVEEILNDLNIDNCEKLLESMLKEGDLFETMPGRLKVLE